jgi:hypothetical protein
MTSPVRRALAEGRERRALERREAYLADVRRIAEARALTPRARAADTPGMRDDRFRELDALIEAEERYARNRTAGTRDAESEPSAERSEGAG